MFLKMTSAAILVLLSVTASAEVHVVQAYPTSFVPATVNVVPGDTIHWVYTGGYPHTVTSGSGCSGDGLFHGVLQIPGDTFEWEVPEGGDDVVSYFCQPHCAAGMTGEILVDNSAPTGHVIVVSLQTSNVAMTYESAASGVNSFAFSSEADTTGSFNLGLTTEGGNAILTVTTASSSGVVLLQIRDTTAGTEASLTPGDVTLTYGHTYVLYGANFAGVAGEFDVLISSTSPDPTEEFIKSLTLSGTSSVSTSDSEFMIQAVGAGSAQLTLASPDGPVTIELWYFGDVTSDDATLPPEGAIGSTLQLPIGDSVFNINESHTTQGLLALSSFSESDPPPCPADVNRNGVVDVDDLLMVIVEWGICP
jgi:plastocyanin